MKKIISFILIILLLICNINVNTYAMNLPDHNFNYDSLESYWKLMQDVGFIVSYPAYSTGKTLGSILKKYLNSVEEGSGDNITSDEDAGNWARNNISINGNGNIVLNSNAKAFLNYSINDYVSSTGMYYVYSFDLLNHVTIFSDGDMFSALRRLVNDNQQNYICVFGNQSGARVALYPNTSNIACIYGSNFNTDIDFNYTYKMSDWTATGPSKIYYYNSSTKEFVEGGNWSLFKGVLCGRKSGMTNSQILQQNSLGGFSFVTLNRTGSLRCYANLNGLKQGSQGVQPYYFNNTVYNNYKNSSGNYTITTDNSNHAAYGDVNTYIDNSTTENGTPPTSTDINIYIEQVPAPTPTPNPTPTPTPTPDNPSGDGDNTGGSVSGNTANGGNASASATANNSGVNVTVNNNHNISFNVPGLSGNGIGSGTVSGNGNGTGGIFDWISDIGGVIGDFIKNVGQLIADVVKGITETITTVLADIPNIISVLVEFVYGGLPDELKAIVTLGITTVIFVGVIKMMRK